MKPWLLYERGWGGGQDKWQKGSKACGGGGTNRLQQWNGMECASAATATRQWLWLALPSGTGLWHGTPALALGVHGLLGVLHVAPRGVVLSFRD